MKEMTTARGTEPESKVGPLIDARSRDKVHELVTDAVSSGATAVVGGAPVDGPGYFYQPTPTPANCPQRGRPAPRGRPRIKGAIDPRKPGWGSPPGTRASIRTQ